MPDGARLVDQSLVRAIVERLPIILTEVESLLRALHPEYAGFLVEEFDEVVSAARGFVVGLLEQAQLDPRDQAVALRELGGPQQLLFEEIGRRHCREGRDVTALLAAYRSGATVAWRHIVEQAVPANVPAESLAAIATALFAAVDQLSTASLRGYMRQEADDARHRDRSRARLVQLLLSDRSDSAAVAAAARAAGWPLPAGAAVVLISRQRVAASGLPKIGMDCLWTQWERVMVGVVPDPQGPGQRAKLAAALHGFAAVIGVPVELSRLPASLPAAQLALTLRERGVLTADPVHVEEHLAALIVHQRPRLLRSLRARVLAPLDSQPAAARERLEQTLLSWLTQLGNRQGMARELHVHPQTVRYRLAQLRELFGTDLDDPRTRAALTLALAWGAPNQDDLPFGADPSSDRDAERELRQSPSEYRREQ